MYIINNIYLTFFSFYFSYSKNLVINLTIFCDMIIFALLTIDSLTILNIIIFFLLVIFFPTIFDFAIFNLTIFEINSEKNILEII